VIQTGNRTMDHLYFAFTADTSAATVGLHEYLTIAQGL
jgi:hypothetical protein